MIDSLWFLPYVRGYACCLNLHKWIKTDNSHPHSNKSFKPFTNTPKHVSMQNVYNLGPKYVGTWISTSFPRHEYTTLPLLACTYCFINNIVGTFLQLSCEFRGVSGCLLFSSLVSVSCALHLALLYNSSHITTQPLKTMSESDREVCKVAFSCYNSDIIMSAMTSQIAGVSIVCSTICSGAHQKKNKHRSSTSLTVVRGIHRCPMDSPYKGPVTRKMLLFDDVVMLLMGSSRGDGI